MSRAVLRCPDSVSPVTFLKAVFFRPQACACRFIMPTNTSTLPPTASASATAASLPLCTIRPLQQLVDLRRHRRVDEHQRAAALALRPGELGDRQRLLERQLLVAQRLEDDVGGHQLGQRRRVGRGVGVALGERLARRQVEDDVALGGDLGRLRRLRGGDGGDDEQDGGGECARRGTGKTHGNGRVGEVKVAKRGQTAARSCSSRTMTFFSKAIWPWKKWPTPGKTITGQILRPRPGERRGERDDVVALAVDDQRVGGDGRRPPASRSTARSGRSGAADRRRRAGARPRPRRSRRTKSRRAGSGKPANSSRPRQCATHGKRIVDLAAAFVPGAFGGADAAEVEAHAGPAEVEAGARDRLHDLVVERAAELRMRVADDRQAARRVRRPVDRALDPARPARRCARARFSVSSAQAL